MIFAIVKRITCPWSIGFTPASAMAIGSLLDVRREGTRLVKRNACRKSVFDAQQQPATDAVAITPQASWTSLWDVTMARTSTIRKSPLQTELQKWPPLGPLTLVSRQTERLQLLRACAEDVRFCWQLYCVQVSKVAVPVAGPASSTTAREFRGLPSSVLTQGDSFTISRCTAIGWRHVRLAASHGKIKDGSEGKPCLDTTTAILQVLRLRRCGLCTRQILKRNHENTKEAHISNGSSMALLRATALHLA